MANGMFANPVYSLQRRMTIPMISTAYLNYVDAYSREMKPNLNWQVHSLHYLSSERTERFQRRTAPDVECRAGSSNQSSLLVYVFQLVRIRLDASLTTPFQNHLLLFRSFPWRRNQRIGNCIQEVLWLWIDWNWTWTRSIPLQFQQHIKQCKHACRCQIDIAREEVIYWHVAGW